jgi:hypothetical protein
VSEVGSALVFGEAIDETRELEFAEAADHQARRRQTVAQAVSEPPRDSRNGTGGMGFTSGYEAVVAGWSEIDYAPELPMANFVGLCPDCREAFENWPTAEDRNNE